MCYNFHGKDAGTRRVNKKERRWATEESGGSPTYLRYQEGTSAIEFNVGLERWWS